MEKILCIGFSQTGTTKPFTRLNLMGDFQKATFGRKHVMDFCFVELTPVQEGVFKDQDNILYSLCKTDNAPFFQRDLNVKKESDGRLVLSVIRLNDFLPYVEKLTVTLRDYGRSHWAKNWKANLEKNLDVICDHVFNQYGLSLRPETEPKEDETKVVIVR